MCVCVCVRASLWWVTEALITTKVQKLIYIICPSFHIEEGIIRQQHTRIYKKLNSMVWVREGTEPTERPPRVGEAIANLRGKRVPRGQRDGSLRPYSLDFLDRSRYFSIK
jgi:hypothetical protein